MLGLSEKQRRKAVTVASGLLLVLAAVLQSFTMIAQAESKKDVTSHVDVKHVLVDRAGKEVKTLIEPERAVEAEVVGTEYTVEPDEELLDDYVLFKTPANANGKVKEDDSLVTFKYIEEEAINGLEGMVVTKYVDDEGFEISDRTILTKVVGTPYQTTEKVFDTYSLEKVTGEEEGTFESGSVTITYNYEKNKSDSEEDKKDKEEQVYSTVTTEYVDTDKNPIAMNAQVSGKIGEEYTITPKAIEGYTFVDTEGDVRGKYTKDGEHITYVYKVDKKADVEPREHVEVILQHIEPKTDNENSKDEDDTHAIITDADVLKELDFTNVAASEVFVGEVGTSYAYDTKAIDGLLPGEDSYNLVFQSDVPEMAYVYEEAPIIGTVIASHVDTDGKSLADDVKMTGEVGESYTTIPLDIEGYDIVGIQGGDTDGVFTVDEIRVVYEYEKQEEEAEVEEDKAATDGEKSTPDSADKDNDEKEVDPPKEKTPAVDPDHNVDEPKEKADKEADNKETNEAVEDADKSEESSEDEEESDDTDDTEHSDRSSETDEPMDTEPSIDPETITEESDDGDVAIDDSLEEVVERNESPMVADDVDTTINEVDGLDDTEDLDDGVSVLLPVDMMGEEDIIDTSLEESNKSAAIDREVTRSDDTPRNTIDAVTDADEEGKGEKEKGQGVEHIESKTDVENGEGAGEQGENIELTEIPQAGMKTNHGMMALGLLFVGLAGLTLLRRKGFDV